MSFLHLGNSTQQHIYSKLNYCNATGFKGDKKGQPTTAEQDLGLRNTVFNEDFFLHNYNTQKQINSISDTVQLMYESG